MGAHGQDGAGRTCRLFRVTGRVQGVFFRASTRREAQSLGLRGYARNMDDGSVEVLACGDPAGIDRLAAWLEQGPPGARVERVTAQDRAWEQRDSFTTG